VTQAEQRDDLGIYIPRRLTDLTPDEIIAEIDQRRAQREALLLDIASHTPASKPRREKATDLTKVAFEDSLVILAVQMGIPVDELKRIIGTVNNGS
jgi:hypothetical protein